MSDLSERQSSAGWVKEATLFLGFGYQIVPLAPMSGRPKETNEPVVRQLGAEPLVDPVDGAASTQSEIEKLGEQFEEARIGALTGKESDLLAVELKKGEAEVPLFSGRIASFAEGAARIVSSSREYVLFPYPRVEDSLPAITEKKDAVLHGDGSVIFLPGGRFEWKDRFFDENGEVLRREERRRNARGILTLFGLEDHLAPKEETSHQHKGGAPPTSEPKSETEEASQLDLPLGERRSNGQSRSSGSETPFRSGEELRPASDRHGGRLTLPWTVPGGLSVLTGPPKTAGKSSWILNLSVHLVAGEPFLGYENSPSEVVLLADTAPAAFRESLAQFQFVQDNAFARLHVLHPGDVKSRDWLSTLFRAYEHAETVGADLLIVDCLDCYIRVKGGPSPTESEDVAHTLTAESPPGCPVLGVKSTDCSAGESISRTIDRLGILGLSADAVLRLDNVSTDPFPCLRRLVMAGRQGRVSQTHLCALRSGRYVRVRREDLAGLSSEELLSGPARPGGTTALDAGSNLSLPP